MAGPGKIGATARARTQEALDRSAPWGVMTIV